MAKKPTKYTVTDGKMVLVLEPCAEGGYTVTAPFITGLVTEANSIEEAFEMARDAERTMRAKRDVPPAQRIEKRRGGRWRAVRPESRR
jgi:antitoxin HicB